jgi:hypothetical protein
MDLPESQHLICCWNVHFYVLYLFLSALYFIYIYIYIYIYIKYIRVQLLAILESLHGTYWILWGLLLAWEPQFAYSCSALSHWILVPTYHGIMHGIPANRTQQSPQWQLQISCILKSTGSCQHRQTISISKTDTVSHTAKTCHATVQCTTAVAQLVSCCISTTKSHYSC